MSRLPEDSDSTIACYFCQEDIEDDYYGIEIVDEAKDETAAQVVACVPCAESLAKSVKVDLETGASGRFFIGSDGTIYGVPEDNN